MSCNNSFGRTYWQAAALELKNTRSLVFASLIVVLRIVVKAFKSRWQPGSILLSTVMSIPSAP